jgi:ubiquinone/menaquinone biosynthesis C-methylase UbiE
MQRVDAPEILDTDACLPHDAQAVLAVLGRINRWFGGVTTTQKMVNRVARAAGVGRLSLLEVAAGLGEVPEIVRQRLARRGIALDITLLDMAHSHLPIGDPSAAMNAKQNHSVVADALTLPFSDGAFDLVSCCLFTHHLDPRQLKQFVREALRVCRKAVLINDLVRHPLHLALVYASFPLMRNRVAWLDGLTSVRRSYTPHEMGAEIFAAIPGDFKPQIEISRHYLFRMGITVRKAGENKS